jgi:hypothetical protein
MTVKVWCLYSYLVQGIFKQILKLYTNTVFESDGTRETIPLKMFCSPMKMRGVLTPQTSFWDIPERESLYNNAVF